MSVNLESLLKAIDKLEETINIAKSKIVSKKDQLKYASRFDSYKHICDMQRRFSQDIFYLKALNNKNEVVRKVQLINGLSALILDDIRQISIQIALNKKNENETESAVN